MTDHDKEARERVRQHVRQLLKKLTGCVVQQKSRGVFPAEHLPPPPSEPGLKGAPGRTEAQAGAPERKPLSVPR
jgi:hypothetical protein